MLDRTDATTKLLLLVIMTAITSGNCMPFHRRNDRANLPTAETFLHRIRTMLIEIQQRVENGGFDNTRDIVEVHRRLTDMLTQVRQVNALPNTQLGQLEISLQRLAENSSTLHQIQTRHESSAFSINRIQNNLPGPCPYDVREDHIQFLHQYGFSTSQMLSVLQPISRSTLYRRLRSFGIRLSARYTTINNDELQGRIETLHHRYPRVGQRLMLSLLRAEGVHIQRNRVRTILRNLDPMGTAIRWSDVIQRRRYHVPHPNYLWHLDSNHALITWGFVVSCSMDGYSRLITHLRIATNNRAITTLRWFLGGCRQYGTPSRVRIDPGGENYLVAQFMILRRGMNRGSVLSGSSVHNQRVERFWRDCYARCLHVYYELFTRMQLEGILNVENNTHMYALHYVFLPRIGRDLDLFRRAWNRHQLSSEHNQTPIQLWILGATAHVNTPRTGINIFSNNQNNSLNDVFEHFGIDENELHDAPIPSRLVDNIYINISPENVTVLEQTFNPLTESRYRGVDIYGEVLSFLISRVT